MRCSGSGKYRTHLKPRPICLFLAAAGAAFSATPPKSALAHDRKPEFLTLPLSFEANRGQTDPTVKFLSRGDGYALFLTSDGAVFKLRPSRRNLASVVRMKLIGASPDARVSGADALPGTVNYFIGNDPDKWTNHVPTFGRVKVQEIYKGIDQVYYGTERRLEFDFIVAPGADPGRIGLEFAGATPTLAPDGSLALTLNGPQLTLRKPVIYQTIAGARKTIAGNYKLSGHRVEFVLGKYDQNRALVIDPVLSYLTYLGGSMSEMVGNLTYGSNPTQGAVVDAAGNVYVTGYTQSTDFPVLNAIQPTNTSTAGTGFITKLNPTGSQLIYSTYLGGSVAGDGTTTRPYAIAVDSSGNAYVTGFTNSPKFPATAGAYQTACGFVGTNGMSNCPGAQSAFLTKLSPSGGLVYSTFFGHSNETAVAIAVDSSGQAYIAGDTVDQCTALSGGNAVGPAMCFPTTANAVLPGSTFNTTVNPNNFNQGSAFISVFDAAGANLLYSSLFGGTGNQAVGNGHPTYGSGVAVDASGYFYLAGTTGSNELPVTQGCVSDYLLRQSHSGLLDGHSGVRRQIQPGKLRRLVVLHHLPRRNRPDATGLPGLRFRDCSRRRGQCVYQRQRLLRLPGYSRGVRYGALPLYFVREPQFSGQAQSRRKRAGVGHLCRERNQPDPECRRHHQPPAPGLAGQCVCGRGRGRWHEYPLVNPLQPANEFAGMYVTMYNPTGSAIYFSTVIYNTTNNTQVVNGGVDVDSQGNIYVAGITSATSLPVTAGAFQPAAKGPAGTNNAFIAKINTSGPTPTVKPGGIVPVYSSVSAVQTGEWVSIYGANLATETASWNPGTFPTQLGGTSVTIDGKLAYLWYVSPTQINLQVPNDTTIGTRAGSDHNCLRRSGLRHCNSRVRSSFFQSARYQTRRRHYFPVQRVRRVRQRNVRYHRSDRDIARLSDSRGKGRRHRGPFRRGLRAHHSGRFRRRAVLPEPHPLTTR